MISRVKRVVFQILATKHQRDTSSLLRPLRQSGDTKAIDESTNTGDTIEWLLKNVPNNNGSVGMLGVSYEGCTTVMGMLDTHPALKAVPRGISQTVFVNLPTSRCQLGLSRFARARWSPYLSRAQQFSDYRRRFSGVLSQDIFT